VASNRVLNGLIGAIAITVPLANGPTLVGAAGPVIMAVDCRKASGVVAITFNGARRPSLRAGKLCSWLEQSLEKTISCWKTVCRAELLVSRSVLGKQRLNSIFAVNPFEQCADS
jgi:hypothetical protein